MTHGHESVGRIEIENVIRQRNRPEELHAPLGVGFLVHHPCDPVHHFLRTVKAALPVTENVVHLSIRPHAVGVLRIVGVPLQPVRDVPDDPPIPHESRQIHVVHRFERRLRRAAGKKRQAQHGQQPKHLFHPRSKPAGHLRVKLATRHASLATPLHFLLFPRTRPSHAVR